MISTLMPLMSDIVTSEYIDCILTTKRWSVHGSDIDCFIDDELPEEMLGLSKDELVNLDCFVAFLKSWLESRYNYVVRDLLESINTETITINRAVYLTDMEFAAIQSGEKGDIGYYWGLYDVSAYDVDPNNVNGKKLYLCSAQVNITDVNWHETFISRMDYDNGDQEQEINTKGMGIPEITKIENQFGELIELVDQQMKAA
jgi:hypothetical protein